MPQKSPDVSAYAGDITPTVAPGAQTLKETAGIQVLTPPLIGIVTLGK